MRISFENNDGLLVKCQPTINAPCSEPLYGTYQDIHKLVSHCWQQQREDWIASTHRYAHHITMLDEFLLLCQFQFEIRTMLIKRIYV